MTNAQIIGAAAQALAEEGKIKYTGRVIKALNPAGEEVEIKETEEINKKLETYVVPEEDDRVLNPIAQEVSTMENHPIIKITIPPYDESEESTEEEE